MILPKRIRSIGPKIALSLYHPRNLSGSSHPFILHTILSYYSKTRSSDPFLRCEISIISLSVPNPPIINFPPPPFSHGALSRNLFHHLPQESDASFLFFRSLLSFFSAVAKWSWPEGEKAKRTFLHFPNMATLTRVNAARVRTGQGRAGGH